MRKEKTKRYNQVKDLVRWAMSYHARMAKQYGDAAEEASSERVKMALNYLANRELRMQTGLEDIFHDGTDHTEVLETWFDEVGDFPHPPKLERIAETANYDSIDAIMETAVTEHSTLQDLYQHRASRANVNPEKEFFNSLAEGHEAEMRRIVTSLEELEDI
ncbi:2-hydroxyacyl-CoA dehydratase [Halomonas sp. ZH2S]|uniref:2-hydroxyacyl-CoA dehydratase n=1 Tax=Vreelandella zhuhanensis TaxID=2684210 RepID=A0A7X3H0M7_9GAMM|nr:2-hydroxyacyl-CoA dehydratase [Halomonas zhuhanensis]MWJ28352.1 2-hydroxyacyl-CoA dehydratase [Halomonas zhuhanensis]